MMNYCTYITVHIPTGMYYIGKSSVGRINKGYRGSGSKLRSALKETARDDWQTGILWHFETADEALSDEGGILTDAMLNDPLCLNIAAGGKVHPTPTGKHYPRKSKETAAQKEMRGNSISKAKKGVPAPFAEGRVSGMKGKHHTAESKKLTSEKVSAARKALFKTRKLLKDLKCP